MFGWCKQIDHLSMCYCLLLFYRREKKPVQIDSMLWASFFLTFTNMQKKHMRVFINWRHISFDVVVLLFSLNTFISVSHCNGMPVYLHFSKFVYWETGSVCKRGKRNEREFCDRKSRSIFCVTYTHKTITNNEFVWLYQFMPHRSHGEATSHVHVILKWQSISSTLAIFLFIIFLRIFFRSL